ncbi:MAG: DUF1207 domain-containing protein [Planctomycetota bacterium]
MMDRMRRIGRIGMLVALLTAPSAGPATARTDDELRLFPKLDRRGEKVQLLPAKDRLLKPLLADPEEAQVRVAYGFPGHDDGEQTLDAVLGANLVLLRWNVKKHHALDLSIRGLASSRFETRSESFDQMASDFHVGAAIAWQHELETLELLIYHESSHLGDETLDFGKRERFNYSRQAGRLLWSHDTDQWRLYGGGEFNFDTSPGEINKTVVIRGGVESYFVLGDQDFYTALDVQVREYNDWNANLNAQVGWFVGPADHDNRPRLFLEAFTGHSTLGQFWDESETIFSVGLALGL